MQTGHLYEIVRKGKKESYKQGQVFYSLDFNELLFLLLDGYVKRCQIKENQRKIIESIYGPGYYFPLSQVYKSVLAFDLNQEHITYTYEAMTDVKVASITGKKLAQAAEADPIIYKELLSEAGRRLNANINRLASNSLADDYKKIAHQLVCLAVEFGSTNNGKNNSTFIKVPLGPEELADQLNINPAIAIAVVDAMQKQKLIQISGRNFVIEDMPMLRDSYL